MPELPEVESLRKGLDKVLRGRTIRKVVVKNKKLVSGSGTIRKEDNNKAKSFIQNLENKKIESVSRRAKNLIIHTDHDDVVMIHLKMTGQLVHVDHNKNKIKNEIITGGHPIEESYKQQLPHKHTHIIFELDRGTLYYNDVRKFGYVLHYKSEDEINKQNHFKNIGLEPFDKNFTAEYLFNALQKKNKALKTVLLEQSAVTGCGNIYADEVCFASRIRPDRNCKSLNKKEVALIHKNIIQILSRAIELGGSSISDYLLADGSRGNFAREHKIYGRAGEKCARCKNILEKIVVSSRTTVLCPNCQK